MCIAVRVVRIVLHGLTRREISGDVAGPGLVDAAARGSLDAVHAPRSRPARLHPLAMPVISPGCVTSLVRRPVRA